jgi:hypothetical protein
MVHFQFIFLNYWHHFHIHLCIVLVNNFFLLGKGLKALFADFNFVNANGYIMRSVFAMNGLLHLRCKRGREGGADMMIN